MHLRIKYAMVPLLLLLTVYGNNLHIRERSELQINYFSLIIFILSLVTYKHPFERILLNII